MASGPMVTLLAGVAVNFRSSMHLPEVCFCHASACAQQAQYSNCCNRFVYMERMLVHANRIPFLLHRC